MSLLYREIKNREEWFSLMRDRIHTGWYYDDDLTKPAKRADSEAAGDDIYTQYGWNVLPRKFPVLAHIEAKAHD